MDATNTAIKTKSGKIKIQQLCTKLICNTQLSSPLSLSQCIHSITTLPLLLLVLAHCCALSFPKCKFNLICCYNALCATRVSESPKFENNKKNEKSHTHECLVINSMFIALLLCCDYNFSIFVNKFNNTAAPDTNEFFNK